MNLGKLTPSAATPLPVIAAENVHKRLAGRPVLSGVSMAAYAGQLVAIVGENGSGKSTLLRILAGALRADRGRVWRRGTLGYCPQEAVLYPHLTPDEHIALFGAAYGLPRRVSEERGKVLLDRFAFARYARRPAGELSGGTRKKLNLALALLLDPAVLLLDEPYSDFDIETYRQFTAYTSEARRRGKCIVLVTHMLLGSDEPTMPHDTKGSLRGLLEMESFDAVFGLFAGGIDGSES